ncbi:anti-sigma factor family protein [Halomonas nitroreducens]|uniref:Putative zinc-finger domain-containing protein n=1 Tax=Halomonas nitroreducens TaxID=447425 RepID=A0A431V047_9GAMM|nr:zf-HC2 domain-containing protein [Halomonas nitroreducens]RTQ99154.1 hypothetical protein EKG36_18090 [Halomonas nitroreducens]
MSDHEREHAGAHGDWLERVAPYLDGELNEEEHRAMAQHLEGCELCRRELARQRALVQRLRPLAPALGATDAMARRLRRRGMPPARRHAPRHLWGWLGWSLAAVQACLLAVLLLPGVLERQGVPMVRDAVADYQRVLADELPRRTTDTAALSRSLSLSIERLEAPGATFLGAWKTVLQEQPAAALAYRVKDQTVVQYVVSGPLFFNQARVRDAVSRHGQYVTRQGRQAVVGWPGNNAGSLLVGELPSEELVRLRL